MMIASVCAAFSKQRSAEKLWMEEIQHHWGWAKREIDYLLTFRCCEKLRGPMVGYLSGIAVEGNILEAAEEVKWQHLVKNDGSIISICCETW